MKYLNTAQSAKLMRNELKTTFPGQKFSVRSKTYSGGSSIDVSWTDGPSEKAVKLLVGKFESKGFDGSVDYAYYKRHYLLADGTVMKAGSEGSACTGGYVAAWKVDMPEGAEEVQLGSGYIFTNRYISKEFEAKCQAAWDGLEGQKQCDLINGGVIPRWENCTDGYKYAHSVSAQEVAA